MTDPVKEKTQRKPVSGCMMIISFIFIIVILLLIALANTMEPCKRSKLARMKSDMRSLATAIESYYIDYEVYPPHTYDNDYKLNWSNTNDVPTFDRRYSMTTPISFISRYPVDVFHGDKKTHFGLAYFCSGESWLLVSAGPDADYDTRFALFPTSVSLSAATSITLHFVEMTENAKVEYDPTNGTYSSGDIYHPGGAGKTTMFSHWPITREDIISTLTTETSH